MITIEWKFLTLNLLVSDCQLFMVQVVTFINCPQVAKKFHNFLQDGQNNSFTLSNLRDLYYLISFIIFLEIVINELLIFLQIVPILLNQLLSQLHRYQPH